MNRIEKWTSECLEQGFKWLGKVDGARSRCECMVCGHVDDYRQGDIRRGEVRCSSCHETKMKNECLQQGFEWIHKVDGNNSLCRCLVCGYEGTYQQGAMRKGDVRCSSCHETKMKNECLDQGFEWIRKVDGHHSLCRCLSCCHQDTFQQVNMRKGEVRCSSCHETKMKNECLNQGFEWIRKVNGDDSLCKCLSCGNQGVFDQSAMRRGEVRCSSCQETKMKNECLDQGFEWIRKVDGHHSLCRCLTCWHEDTFSQSAMRDGRVSCSICSPGHWNEECFFYMARIIHGNSTIIKIGVAADPHKRYTQYGLKPYADITEILRLRFDTKLEAVEFESNMKSLLKPLHIHPDVAKLTLTYSGFTECYAHLAEDVVKESFV